MSHVPRPDPAHQNCFEGYHSDPDNSGMCIYCCLLLYCEPGEEPNSYRRDKGWSDVPEEPKEIEW